jgi:GntR family transcriptional regulator / MocR family aminotransferase
MLRPWELNFTISRESHQSIHQQLTHKLIHAIQSGAFVAGMSLPGTRELSQQLGINRKTVIRVYDELIAQGWLYTEDKRGTFVSQQKTINHAAAFLNTLQTTKHQMFAPTAQQDSPSLPHTALSDEWIDLSYPHGDHRLFNIEVMVRATRHAIITTKRHSHLKLHHPHRLEALRQAIAQMLGFEKSMHVAPQQLCIAPSAQLSLDIIAKAIFRQSDYLLLETLHDPITGAIFQQQNINIQTVKHHAQGLDLDDLEKLCINYPVRAIYLSPECQQPTTWRMTADNRTQLLKLAKRYDFYVIEDSTRAQFSYERTAPATLASLAQQHVIHVGSLAHLMNASYKAAYIAAPHHLSTAIEQALSFVSDCSNLMNELTLTELLLSGEVKKQLKRAQKIYQERRDYCCKLMQQVLGEYIHFETPSAGFSIWAQTNKVIAQDTFAKHLHQQQLKLNVETVFHQNIAGQTSFAIYFAHLNNDELKIAINRLKLALFATQKTERYAAYG